MKLIRFSIDLLKRERKSSLLYVLSLSLSTTAIHSLISIYLNPLYFSTDFDHNVGYLQAGYTVMWLSVVCIVLLAVYAHNYFLTEKYQIIGIMRLGGSGFSEVLSYIFVQTFILLLIAIPFGLILGSAIYQLFHYIFCTTNNIVYAFASMSYTGIAYSLLIISVLIFYLAIVTVGFVHRHEIKELLGYKASMKREQEDQKILSFSVPGIIPLMGVLFTIFYCILKLDIIDITMGMGVFSLAFLMGSVIKKCIHPFIGKLRKKVFINNKIMMTTLSFVSLSLLRLSSLTRLLAGAVVFNVCYMAQFSYSNADFMYFYLLFLIFITLTSLAILYQIMMESNTRIDSLKQLYTLGFTKKDINQVMKKEIIITISIVGVIGFMYTDIALISAIINNYLSGFVVLQLVAIYVVSLIIVGVVSYKNYKEIIAKEID